MTQQGWSRFNSSPTVPSLAPNSNVAAHVAAATYTSINGEELLVWQAFFDLPELQLEQWYSRAGKYEIAPGAGWQNRVDNQPNEDSRAVNPFCFTVEKDDSVYNLRKFKPDPKKPLGGSYQTGGDVRGDFLRARAHRTLPCRKFQTLDEDQKIDIGKAQP